MPDAEEGAGDGAELTAKEASGLRSIEVIDRERFEREQARRRKFLEKREAAAKKRRKEKQAQRPQFAMYRRGSAGGRFSEPEKAAHSTRGKKPADPPITYNHLSSKERAPAAPLSFRPKQLTCMNTPGPGSYSTPSIFSAASHTGGPRFHKPLKEKEMPMFFNVTPSPGPNTYSLPSEFSPSYKKGFSITSNLELTNGRAFSSHDPPGPGTYKIPPTIGTSNGRIVGTAFSLSGRTRGGANHIGSSAVQDCSPGPGAYNPAEAYSVNGPSFTSARQPLPAANGPGPGAYNTTEMGNTKGTVTIKGRTPLMLPQKGQGPPSTLYNVAPPAKDPPTRRAPRVRSARAITAGPGGSGDDTASATPPPPRPAEEENLSSGGGGKDGADGDDGGKEQAGNTAAAEQDSKGAAATPPPPERGVVSPAYTDSPKSLAPTPPPGPSRASPGVEKDDAGRGDDVNDDAPAAVTGGEPEATGNTEQEEEEEEEKEKGDDAASTEPAHTGTVEKE